MTTHKNPSDRVAEMLHAALKLAAKHGYQNVTREQIASSLGVAPSLVSHHLGTMSNLRRSLVRQAISSTELTVIAQAIAAGDPHARRVPHELRRRALESLQ